METIMLKNIHSSYLLILKLSTALLWLIKIACRDVLNLCNGNDSITGFPWIDLRSILLRTISEMCSDQSFSMRVLDRSPGVASS